MNWLEKQYPNIDPVIEFFKRNGHDGMTVVSNGYDDVIYRYSLPEYPNARYMHITSATNTYVAGGEDDDKADFIPPFILLGVVGVHIHHF